MSVSSYFGHPLLVPYPACVPRGFRTCLLHVDPKGSTAVPLQSILMSLMKRPGPGHGANSNVQSFPNKL